MPERKKLTTAITRLLGVDHPILLAPMGGVSGGALAGAVSEAGGLGLIGAGYADPALGWGSDEWIAAEFDKAGNRPVGIGFITWALHERPGALDAALEREPSAVMLSFGDIAPYAAKIRDAGAVADLPGPDPEGCKGGGREGRPDRRCPGDRGRRPRGRPGDAAAGSRGCRRRGAGPGRRRGRDRRRAEGLAAALMLGAEAALIGTRFWATPEALGHENQKALIERSGGDDTLRTKVFDTARGLVWPEPWTGRAIRNAFSDTWHGRDDELRAEGPALRERFFAAQREGDTDTAVTFAGEGLDLVADRPGAGALVERIVAEAIEALAAAPRPR